MPVSRTVILESSVSGVGSGAAEPTVALGPDGRVVLSWLERAAAGG